MVKNHRAGDEGRTVMATGSEGTRPERMEESHRCRMLFRELKGLIQDDTSASYQPAQSFQSMLENPAIRLVSATLDSSFDMPNATRANSAHRAIATIM